MRCNMWQKVVLWAYAVVVFFLGILKVPSREVGPEGTRAVSYQPIWNVEGNSIIDGFQTYLEVDLARLAAELVVVTIIALVLYVTLGDSKSR